MKFKKVLSRTLSTIILSSGLLLNGCLKQDTQKDSAKLSSYLLDEKDLQFESRLHKDEFSYILYYIPNKNPDSKKIRYVEIYKNETLYGIINGEVYYLDKNNDDLIDLECKTDKIECNDLSGNSYNKEERVDDVEFREEK